MLFRSPGAFSLNPVSRHQVLYELKKLRSDCSCGPDAILVMFIKLVADSLVSPLTHILHTCLSFGLENSSNKCHTKISYREGHQRSLPNLYPVCPIQDIRAPCIESNRRVHIYRSYSFVKGQYLCLSQRSQYNHCSAHYEG